MKKVILKINLYGRQKKKKGPLAENTTPDQQKICRRQSRETKDHLMIGKMEMKNCKRTMTNLTVAWIDYKNAYGMVPHTWILQCFKIFQVANNVRNVIEKLIKN